MLDLQESEPQDIGPRGKATTVHIMEQEAVKWMPIKANLWGLPPEQSETL